MNREFYIKLSESGIRMPIGADMILKSKPDYEKYHTDGKLLGSVIAETAEKFKTPLAFPLMDLTVEKEWILSVMGIPKAQIDSYHFSSCPSDSEFEKTLAAIKNTAEPTPKMKAVCGALSYVAEVKGLVPVGMSIGPFSLMTKLVTDPITAVFLAGSGIGADDDPDVKLFEMALELATTTILRSIKFQLEAGAKAVCVCEPAANKVYISPKQLEEGSDVFDRYVRARNKQVRDLLAEFDADLVLHDCGELTDGMVSKLASLDPAVMSLGSSRKLWEDARLISKNTVLFGNLPTKKFFSDKDITKEQVAELSRLTLKNMKAAGHPFILGSECDVLSVPGCESIIMGKLDVMMNA